MTMTLIRIGIAGAFITAASAVVGAHITIAPNQSMAGGTEKYTLRVPSEGKVATVAAELELPEGVIVEAIAVPAGWKYEAKRANDRIVAITWIMNIPPGEFAEFAFVARNPRDQKEIVWTLRQRFADGAVSDWTKGPTGAVRSTSKTTLTPRPVQ
jgi:uncharacterized protein YcnI